MVEEAMGQNTGAGAISVTVLPEQIKNGGFLLGRYNLETGALTDVKVIKDRQHVPANTEVTRYALIGVDDNMPGQPLDDFIQENCHGWGGTSPIELYFRRNDGEFARWGPGQASAAATS